MTNYIDKKVAEFDEKVPCLQSGCDQNGTYPVSSVNGCEPAPCQICHEIRLPAKDFIKQALQEAQAEKVKEIVGVVDSIPELSIEDTQKEFANGYNQALQDIINKLKFYKKLKS